MSEAARPGGVTSQGPSGGRTSNAALPEGMSHNAHATGSQQRSSCLHPSSRIAWISTRRGEPAADIISANIIGRYVLHSMMAQMTAPLDELSTAHIVVLEVPPTAAARFEHDLLRLVARIRAQGPEVAVIVQPSLRKKSNKTLWIHRWNRLSHVPFKFYQTCSCKVGNAVPGCHLTCLVGATKTTNMSPCSEVPTLSVTSESRMQSLGGLLFSLCSCLLSNPGDGRSALQPPPSQRLGCNLVSSAPLGVATICTPPVSGEPSDCRVTGGSRHLAGSQQTPNSAHHHDSAQIFDPFQGQDTIQGRTHDTSNE